MMFHRGRGSGTAGFHQRSISLLKFQAAGIPAFLLAIPFNWALVKKAGLSHGPAYFFVLVFQVSLNYVMCKLFVFPASRRGGFFAEFAAFVGGILAIRTLDWLTYLFWVERLHVYFLLAQILNVAVFALVKFLFAERLMSADRSKNAADAP